MGIFSRFSDIVGSNLNSLLERSNDPQKTIRLIIQEMEDTLVEVRTTSARTIAERKELERRLQRGRDDVLDWEQKAELALRKGREDLAKAALLERAKVEDSLNEWRQRLPLYDETLSRLTTEIGQLQDKLDDARARQAALSTRHQAVDSRWKIRRQLDQEPVAQENLRAYEREVDQKEAHLEAHDLGRRKTLAEEIEELATKDRIEQQLAALKAKMAADKNNDV